MLKSVNFVYVFQNPSTEWKYAFEIDHFICFCSKQCEKIFANLHNEKLLDYPNLVDIYSFHIEGHYHENVVD